MCPTGNHHNRDIHINEFFWWKALYLTTMTEKIFIAINDERRNDLKIIFTDSTANTEYGKRSSPLTHFNHVMVKVE